MKLLGLNLNFSDAVNSLLGGLATSMDAGLNSVYGNLGTNDRVGGGAEKFLRSFQTDPSTYYRILEGFPFFSALIDSYVQPLSDVIRAEGIPISHNDKTINAQAQEIIENFHVKKFILDNLENFIKRGSYSAFITIKNIPNLNDPDNPFKTFGITDMVNPFDAEFAEKDNHVIAATFTRKGNAADASDKAKVQFPFYELYTYYYEKKTIKVMTKRDLQGRGNHVTQALTELSKNFDADTAVDKDGLADPLAEIDKAGERAREEFKHNIAIDMMIFRGKGIFEDYLRDLFNLFILDYVDSTISLNDYVKAMILKITVTSAKTDVRKATEVANFLESRLNTNNVDLLSSYSNPFQLINTLQNRILNRTIVLPEQAEYSNISQEQLPDINSLIEKMKADIDERKRNLVTQLGIPEELMLGGVPGGGQVAYRWEMISRNDKMMRTINNLLASVASSIKHFLSAVIYRTTRVMVPISSWDLNYDETAFIKSFEQRSRFATLAERYRDMANMLEIANTIASSAILDKGKFLEYLYLDIKAIDSKFADMILWQDIGAGVGTGNEPEDDMPGNSQRARNSGSRVKRG